MKIAFLFPGQGNKLVESLFAFAESESDIKADLNETAKRLHVDLGTLLRHGGRLAERTEYFQPLLITLVLGISEELKEHGIMPSVVAGHSLGEIAALACAGSIDRTDAIKLAIRRGELMARAAEIHPGGMVATRNGSEESVRKAIVHGSHLGILSLAAWNAPGEYVISGDHEALDAVRQQIDSIRLNITGPWHTSRMEGAYQDFRSIIQETEFTTPRISYICNRSGSVVRDPKRLPELIAGQLIQPVQWKISMDTMRSEACDFFVGIGPAQVLRGLLRKNDIVEPLFLVNTPGALYRTLAALTYENAV